MGVIDDIVFAKAGAVGCSASDYSLVYTTCCQRYLVEDRELGHIYYDAKDLSKMVTDDAVKRCPLCFSVNWSYIQIDEWPRQPTEWTWAYHQDQELVDAWIKGRQT